MHGLDPDAMKAFWRNNDEVLQSKLPHNAKVRKHQFLNPCRLFVSNLYENLILSFVE